MKRVAIVGGYGWVDHAVVRRVIKNLAVQEEPVAVLLDADPTDVGVAAMRECRCSGVNPIQYHLPGNAGRRIVEVRERRDALLFGDADIIHVFGSLEPNRERTLAAVEQRGVPVFRHNGGD